MSETNNIQPFSGKEDDALDLKADGEGAAGGVADVRDVNQTTDIIKHKENGTTDEMLPVDEAADVKEDDEIQPVELTEIYPAKSAEHDSMKEAEVVEKNTLNPSEPSQTESTKESKKRSTKEVEAESSKNVEAEFNEDSKTESAKVAEPAKEAESETTKEATSTEAIDREASAASREVEIKVIESERTSNTEIESTNEPDTDCNAATEARERDTELSRDLETGDMTSEVKCKVDGTVYEQQGGETPTGPETTAPSKKSTNIQRSPKKGVAPSKMVTAPTVKQTTPTVKRTSPIKKQTTPTKKQTAPTRRQTTLARKQATPDKKEVTMSKEVEEEEQMETDGPQLGLLERPVEIQVGKRSRRRVERFAETVESPVVSEKKVNIPEGRGCQLADCPIIMEYIEQSTADSLKGFHRVLYNVIGKTTDVKKNIGKFSGFSFDQDGNEYNKKLANLSKLGVLMIKSFCDLLSLSKSGSKDSLVGKIMDYLMCPSPEGKQVKEKKPQAPAAGSKRKRGDAKRDVVESGDDDESEEAEQPLAKRSRKSFPVKTPGTARGRERMARMSAPSSLSTNSRRKRKREESEEETDGAPSNSRLKKEIGKILKSSDLEKVTMKTVRQQVVDTFPDHDLSDRTAFIKSTVKEILGA